MNSRNIIIYLALIYHGHYEEIYATIRERRLVASIEEINRVAEPYANKVMTILDEDYPEAFKRMRKPPFVLFYEGNISLLKGGKRLVTFFGDREASEYAISKSFEMAEGIAKSGGIVVTGFDRGCNMEAIRGALPYGKVIAFLSTGLKSYFPSSCKEIQQQVAKDGLILSEYPNNEHITTERLHARNRLIGALSDVFFIPETHPQDGIFSLVAYVLQMGKEIAILPHEATPFYTGNLLIREGAALVQNTEDLLYEMGLGEKKGGCSHD